MVSQYRIDTEESAYRNLKDLFKVDTEGCLGIIGDYSRLHLRLPGRPSIEKFAKENNIPVLIDFFSNKDQVRAVVEEMFAQGDIPEAFKEMMLNRYVEMQRMWYIFKHEDMPVGFSDILFFHNSYCSDLGDPWEFARDPQGALDRLLEESPTAIEENPVLAFTISDYKKSSVYLHRDFLAKHPIYDER